MKKILHLLLISILIYFLFFQNVKEGLNENKCDNIYEKNECNNKKKNPQCHMFENEDGTSKCMNLRLKNIDCKSKDSTKCSIDENCGHLITGNDTKSSCVLNYYDKQKHIPFFNQKEYENDDNYISLDKGNVYKHGIMGLGEYITGDSYMGGKISKSDHNPHQSPKFRINLTKNLIKKIHKDVEKANVKYNLKDAINKTFPMYEQDGKSNFTVKLHKNYKENNPYFKYPNIVMKFHVNNSILEINNLPNYMLNWPPIYSALFYVKKGRHLDCEGPNQPEHCKYKKLDTGCKNGEKIKSFPEKEQENALKECSNDPFCFGINKLNGFWNLINPLNNTDTRKFYIGGSGTNIKKVSFPGINLDEYHIPSEAVPGDNPQNPGWGDKFKITRNGNSLSVQRTDSGSGWGQQLSFNLHKSKSKKCYEKLNYKEPVLTNVNIKDFHNKFISGQANGTIGVRNSAYLWETFTLEKQGDKTFAIRSVHGTYLTRSGYNHYLWNSKTIGEREKFNIIKKNNFYIIKQKGTLIASYISRNNDAIFKDRNSEWGSYYHFSIIHSNQNKLDKFLAN